MDAPGILNDQKEHYGFATRIQTLHGKKRHDQGKNEEVFNPGVLSDGQCA